MNPARGPCGIAWRAAVVIVVCGCLFAILTFGLRTTMDLLLPPMNADTGWTRDIFAFAIAIQHIVRGVAQPFGGAVADRLGEVRALCAGASLYAAMLLLVVPFSLPLTTSAQIRAAGASKAD